MKKNGKQNKNSFLKECKIGLLLLSPVLLYILIFGLLSSGCASVELMYSEKRWLEHQIHFQDGDTILICEFCRDYQRQIP